MGGSARRLARRAVGAAAALLAVLAPAGSGAAAPDPEASVEASEPGEEGPIVFVVPPDVAEADAEAALRAVRAHTTGLGAELEVVRPADMPARLVERIHLAMDLASSLHARGVFWVEVSADADLLLYLVPPDGLRVLVRRVPRIADSDAATFESLGVIVRSVGDALVEGRNVGMTPVEVEVAPGPEPTPAPEPEPAEPRAEPGPGPATAPRAWKRVRLAAGYVGTSFAKQLPWQNGIGVSLDVRAIKQLQAGVWYDGVFPDRIEDPLVTLDLQRHVLGLHLGYVASPHGRLGLEIGATGGVELLRRISRDGEVAADGRRSFQLPLVGLRGRLAVRLAAQLWAYVDLGLDGVLVRPTHVVELSDGTLETILEADPVRARVGAGLGYAAF